MKNIGKQDWKFLARIKKKNCRNVIGGKNLALQFVMAMICWLWFCQVGHAPEWKSYCYSITNKKWKNMPYLAKSQKAV